MASSNVWTTNPSTDCLKPADKEKLMFQLGQITWKFAQIRFDRIWSLFEENGNVKLGECMSRRHILHERYSLDGLPRGPFTIKSAF